MLYAHLFCSLTSPNTITLPITNWMSQPSPPHHQASPHPGTSSLLRFSCIFSNWGHGLTIYNTPSSEKILGSGTQGPYQKILKTIYSKPTDNVKLNGEILEAIPLKPGKIQGCSFSPYVFNWVLKVLAGAMRQQEEIKRIQIGKKEIGVWLFADYIIICISDHKNPIRELLQQRNNFIKVE